MKEDVLILRANGRAGKFVAEGKDAVEFGRILLAVFGRSAEKRFFSIGKVFFEFLAMGRVVDIVLGFAVGVLIDAGWRHRDASVGEQAGATG